MGPIYHQKLHTKKLIYKFSNKIIIELNLKCNVWIKLNTIKDKLYFLNYVWITENFELQ